ncbi:SDR family oxidoreductase [Thermostilla marina]
MASDYWKEKVVLVTGGSSGLGWTIVQAFAARGAKIVIVGLEPDAVEAKSEALRRREVACLGLCGDIRRQEDVDRIFQETREEFGGLDVLVNNAGRSMRGSLRSTSPEQFRDLMELNLIALVRCTQAALPDLLARRGHVVNIGSLAAKSAARFVGAYPASKHAVAAFSQQLRLELGPEGLHVLLVCPGPIARDDERLYPLENAEEVPEEARRPGGGVKVKAIRPEVLADRIVDACERRKPEIVMPAKARLLFAISQISPRLGDWLIRKNTP